MTDENVRQVLGFLRDKIPEERMMALKNKLATVDDDRVDEILCTPLFEPSRIMFFSRVFGIFGVDRFMIEDAGLGVAKLFLGWCTFFIWPLIDVFFSYKKAKEKNFNKLMTILSTEKEVCCAPFTYQ